MAERKFHGVVVSGKPMTTTEAAKAGIINVGPPRKGKTQLLREKEKQQKSDENK